LSLLPSGMLTKRAGAPQREPRPVAPRVLERL
jgi:hypothetical protein